MVRFVLSILFAALHLLTLPFQSTTYPYGVDKAMRSVVFVTATLQRGEDDIGKIGCSGEVIAKDRVLTAAHCVGTGKDVQVGVAPEIMQPAQVIKGDQYFDLVLLKVPTYEIPPIALSDALPDPCPGVTSYCLAGVGYGLGHLEVLTGRLLEVNVLPPWDDDPNDAVGLLTDRQWIHGMSGGPVLDTAGQMVGIMQEADEGLGWGVGMQIIRVFLLGTH